MCDMEHMDLPVNAYLMMRLPEVVGSPLSINALCEDLRVSHKTVARWLEALERLYAIFRLLAYGAPGIRAIKKAAKHYHMDWTLPPEPPQQFENLIASHRVGIVAGATRRRCAVDLVDRVPIESHRWRSGFGFDPGFEPYRFSRKVRVARTSAALSLSSFDLACSIDDCSA